MYKHMNLWKIIDHWTFYRGFPWLKCFKFDTEKLLRESFVNFTGVQAKQVNKLLPIGHRWRGDVECYA